MLEWLQNVCAVQKIDGLRRILGYSLDAQLPTVHPTANRYLVETLGNKEEK